MTAGARSSPLCAVANDDDDEIVLPKKGRSRAVSGVGVSGVSRPMLRLMRATRAFGIVLGGFVTVVGLMAVVGIATDNFLARAIVALLVVVVLPALLADRVLKRANANLSTASGIATVVDVFAILLLGVALLLVAADSVTSGMLAREGDRYARSGSTVMARTVYFIAGVSPVFPSEKTGAPLRGASSSAPSASSSAGSK